MTAIAIFVSLLGLAYLAATDAKRRSVYKQPPIASRDWVIVSRAAVFLPGVLFLVSADWSGFTIWAGSITTLGWLMVAVSPNAYASAVVSISSLIEPYAASIQRQAIQLNARLRSRLAGQRVDARVTALEARVDLLERRLSAVQVRERVNSAE